MIITEIQIQILRSIFDRPYQCKFSFYVPISYRGEFPDSCPLRHHGIAVAIKTLSFTAPSCLYTWHQRYQVSPSNPIIISPLFIFVGGHNIDSTRSVLCLHFQMWFLPGAILCWSFPPPVNSATFDICAVQELIIMKCVHKFPFKKLL